MAFMRATIGETPDFFLVSEDLEESVFCKYNCISLPVGEYSEDDDPLEDEGMQEEVNRVFKDLKVRRFETIYKYYGQLSASGYLDQTDYYFGDSQAEVAEQLISAFFDGDREYMDEDELEDLKWLESIADGGFKDETT